MTKLGWFKEKQSYCFSCLSPVPKKVDLEHKRRADLANFCSQGNDSVLRVADLADVSALGPVPRVGTMARGGGGLPGLRWRQESCVVREVVEVAVSEGVGAQVPTGRSLFSERAPGCSEPRLEPGWGPPRVPVQRGRHPP